MTAAEQVANFGYSHFPGGAVSSPNPYAQFGLGEALSITWDPVERWLRKKKPETIRIYKYFAKKFLADYGSPEGPEGFRESARAFLEWAIRQPQWIAVEEALESFASTFKDSQKPIAMSALKSLLQRNGYTRVPKGVPVYRGEFIPGYTREQIVKLLSYLDSPFQKLLVLFQKDDGFRVRTNLALKWHHLKPDYDSGQKFIHLYLEPEYYQGRKTAGISFIGPDAIELLKQLISEGKIKINPDTCDSKHPEKCKCARIFPFGYVAIVVAIKRARAKAALPSKTQPTHGLRKFFENALDKCEPTLDLDKKRQLEGHSIGVRRNYTEQVESLRPLYERAYPHLSLSEEALADQKMKVLLEQVKALRIENETLKEMEFRIETLEAQLAAKVSYQPR